MNRGLGTVGRALSRRKSGDQVSDIIRNRNRHAVTHIRSLAMGEGAK